jgi:hypothetical protein
MLPRTLIHTHQRVWPVVLFWLSAALCCAWLLLLLFSFVQQVVYYSPHTFGPSRRTFPSPGVVRTAADRHLLTLNRGAVLYTLAGGCPAGGPGFYLQSSDNRLSSWAEWLPRLYRWSGGLSGFCMPLWIPVIVCGLVAWVIRKMLYPHWVAAGVCRQCQYNLTGNVSGRCPECGTPISEKLRASLKQRHDLPS